MPSPATIDEKRALRHLLDLLAIDGVSGEEGRVATAVRRKLATAGCKRSWMRHDDAHRRISADWEVGNLIVKLPGTLRAPRRLFMGHLDTVPLCRGAVPVRRGDRIVSRGATALGGDNRTSVACLVTLIETLLGRGLPHPPITALFTVGEEVGLKGSRQVRAADLGRPRMGFNIDSGKPAEIIIGAVGAERWEAEVLGRSAHAGVHPERGISAALIASRAITEVASRGYFGKVVKRRKHGTSNVGSVRGGEASNQVTDRVFIRGESRSDDPAFMSEITDAYRNAFEKAARSVRDHRGRTGKVRFEAALDYGAYLMDESEPTAQFAARVARSLRLRPKLIAVKGGLDASNLNAKGVPTVTVGAGQHGAHTIDEYVEIKEFLAGCRYVVALATTAED